MSQYVGIDLAWSTRAQTGVAVTDEDGRLLESGVVVTDAELAHWIEVHAPNPAVIAIDAPLVVTNPGGQRECEKLIGRAFGRYHASAHTSNLSRAYLNPPRAAALSEELGWNVDPQTSDTPACIEVYPHPAMVALWKLPRVIPYKAKGGRSVEQRRAAFKQLLRHLESMERLGLQLHPRWTQIRASVAGAERQVDLERLEDEIDAVLCAHLAWLWRHEPDALQVYGSLADGYIVAPPPPTHSHVPDTSLTPATESVSFDVQGRPTGYAGGPNETAWKGAVRAAAVPLSVPADARFRVELKFRLQPDQIGRLEPDLDNLIKSTIDALEGVLGLRPGRHRTQPDDVRVSEIQASKMWSHSADSAGVHVTVSTL